MMSIPSKNTLESCKEWIAANCPCNTGKLNFLHEGLVIHYRYIDFYQVSPLLARGDLIFYVDSPEYKEADLLYLCHKKTKEKKIGYLLPVKIDQDGNERKGVPVANGIGTLDNIIILKYTKDVEEYLLIDDFDTYKIINFIHKK